MPSALVTFNGRITLPTDIRKQLGLKTGDKVEFVEIGDGQFALRPRADAGNETMEDSETGLKLPKVTAESVQ